MAQPPQVTPLMTKTLTEIPGWEVLMMTVEYAPGGAENREDIHVVGRNASQTKPAKFLVFLLKDKGAPALVLTQ